MQSNSLKLVEAAKQDSLEEVQTLLSSGFFHKKTLTEALFAWLQSEVCKKSQICKCLISAGAQLQLPEGQVTALMLAAQLHPELVPYFIQIHCSTRAQDSQGRNAIMYALNGSQDPHSIISLLLSKGADPRNTDNKGNTPLHLAAQSNFTNSLKLLLKNGANPKATNKHNRSPLELARGECLEVLQTRFSKNLKKAKYKKVQDSKDLVAQNKALEEELEKLKTELENEKRNKRKIFETKQGRIKELEKQLNQMQDCTQQISYLEKKLTEVTEERNKLYSKTQNGRTKHFPQNSPVLFVKYSQTSLNLLTLQKNIEDFILQLREWQQTTLPVYQELVSEIISKMKECYPLCSVETYGSYATGLLLPYSDIDLVVGGVQENPAVLLQSLVPSFKSLPYVSKVHSILKASIPLVKVYCEVASKCVSVDITAAEEKHKGVSAVELVQKFINRYSTLSSIYLVIKQLMYFNNFHEAFRGGISSYCLFLLMVFYYQEQGAYWEASVANDNSRLSEILAKVLYFFAWEFDYMRFILVHDPDEPEPPQQNVFRI